MRERLPWIITTVALVVAAVALTLWWAGDDTKVPAERLTVKEVVGCQTLNPGASSDSPPAVECARRYAKAERDACANPIVVAVELTIRFGNGDGLPSTVLCGSLSSSSS